MKELIEGLLLVALLKFLGVPMWLISLGSALFLIGFFVYMFIQSADSRRRARELAVAAVRKKTTSRRN
jgi:hypothetical protein